MLPGAIISNPVPVPIVNTTLPGTTVTHVPYDNVAPSISNARVDNNASPNNGSAAAEAEAEQAAAASEEDQSFSTAATGATAQAQVNAQATFLTQLLSQDAAPPIPTILLQYEKLVALGNVKYKPSNAFKPVPAPANTFGKILQEGSAAPTVTVQHTAQPVALPEPVNQQPAIDHQVSQQPVVQTEAVLPAPAPEPQQQAAEPQPQPHEPPPAANNNTPSIPQISAYTATAGRVAIQSAEKTTSLA
jgi:hypothetical protein